MAHPQSSARGLFAKKKIQLGNSTSTLSYNTTGVTVSGALYLSGQGAGGKLSANSTAITAGGGLVATGTLVVGAQAVKGLISANSTSLTLPGNLKITGAAAAALFTANSTGIKIGAKYITTNSTGTTIA